MVDYERIGAELRRLRKLRGYTMQEVGNQLGVTKVCVHMWETGKRRIDIDSLEEYCTVLWDTLENFMNRIGADMAELEEETQEKQAENEWTMLINYPNGTQAFISSNDIELLTDYLSNLERR